MKKVFFITIIFGVIVLQNIFAMEEVKKTKFFGELVRFEVRKKLKLMVPQIRKSVISNFEANQKDLLGELKKYVEREKNRLSSLKKEKEESGQAIRLHNDKRPSWKAPQKTYGRWFFKHRGLHDRLDEVKAGIKELEVFLGEAEKCIEQVQKN